MNTPNSPVLFELFGKAIPPQFFDQLRVRLSLPACGIYSLGVVVWLIMWRRLDDRGSLATAVQQVVQGALGGLGAAGKTCGGAARVEQHGSAESRSDTVAAGGGQQFRKVAGREFGVERRSSISFGCDVGIEKQRQRCREGLAEDNEMVFKDQSGRRGRAYFNCCRCQRAGETAKACPLVAWR